MPITISLPSALSRLAGGQRTLEAGGPTVGDAVSHVSQRYPALAPRLADEHGAPYAFVTFYLNDEDIRFNGGFAAPLQDGDEITIVSAVAGG